MGNSNRTPIDFLVHEYMVSVKPTSVDFLGIEIIDDFGIPRGKVKEHNKDNNMIKIGLFIPTSYSELLEQGIGLEHIIPIYSC